LAAEKEERERKGRRDEMIYLITFTLYILSCGIARIIIEKIDPTEYWSITILYSAIWPLIAVYLIPMLIHDKCYLPYKRRH
jgi:hypothetical protein